MRTILLLLCLLFASPLYSQNQSDIKTIIKGYPGQTIDKLIEHQIKAKNIDMLVDPFKVKNETWCWQSEFWGKWMLSAVGAQQYRYDEAFAEKMRIAVDGLLATQLKNGYIGNYGEDKQLTAWDVWGRKYTLLGLIKYYELTGNKKALKGASKLGDYVLSQLGTEKVNIIETGLFRGMASSSILEPMVYLYKHTGNKDYLNFANYIVKQWESDRGPKLISKALAKIPVQDRFPKPDKWWTWENGQKAYEMMSCYDGLYELYKITGNRDYLQAVINTADNILEAEINIAGSGSAFECWYGTIENQTRPAYHTMETCVTTTWMKLCNKLTIETGDSKYADAIESAFYNALMASVKYDASEISKYSPLVGHRKEGEGQCKLDINCCTANGPRGFAMIPQFATQASKSDVIINYYGESESQIGWSNGSKTTIVQTTDYPESGDVNIEILMEQKKSFSVKLRIPSWSQNTAVWVNGESVDGIQSGSYLVVDREWTSGDEIKISLDMRGKLHHNNGHQAITRGPILLSRDSRFGDGFVDESIIVQNKAGIVELTKINNEHKYMWLSFTAPCLIGTDLEGEGREAREVRFCDFSSAGNTWDANERYRVWLPKTLNVMNAK